MKLKDLQRASRTTVMKWEGEELKLVYQPSRYTPALESEIKGTLSDPTSPWQAEALVRFLAGLVEEWDLLDDDGSVLDLTEGNLSMLPVEVLAEMMATIGEDMRPGEAGRPSVGG